MFQFSAHMLKLTERAEETDPLSLVQLLPNSESLTLSLNAGDFPARRKALRFMLAVMGDPVLSKFGDLNSIPIIDGERVLVQLEL